jgi:hypothetical protein
MRKVDSNVDGGVNVNELMTTLMDWTAMQKMNQWQVGKEILISTNILSLFSPSSFDLKHVSFSIFI